MTDFKIMMSTICKNEAKTIGRLLASVVPEIDAAVVCDTGSEEGTQDVVNHALRKATDGGNFLGYAWYEIPFENFSQARNHALQEARNYIEFMGWDPTEWYFLLLDADHELQVLQANWKEQLDGKEAYYLQQADGVYIYSNIRLVRADIACEYVGATHEYLSRPGGPTGEVTGLRIHDHGDGGSKADKFERDLRLLRDSLATKPDDARAWFYMAQTLFDMGRPQDAIPAYEKRIARGGWAEEVWYAKYRLAQCYRVTDDAQFVSKMLEAYEARPTRAESLYQLARHYRLKGQSASSVLFAKEARTMQRPDDKLFVERVAYEYGPREELAISGYYCPEHRRTGRECCYELAIERKVPVEVRDVARRNCHFYAQSAKDLFEAEEFKLVSELPDGFHPCNPSVFNEGGVLKANVRGVNYTIRADGSYDVPGGIVRTKNWQMVVGEGGLHEVPSPHHRRKILSSARIKGREDMRPFASSLNGRPGYICAVVDMVNDGIPHQAVYDPHTGRLTVQTYGGGVQKNWLPFTSGNYAVYSTDPLIILRWDHPTQQFVEHLRSVPKVALDHLRGSSQVIPFAGGWLYVVHEVAQFTRRSYLHRFVWLTTDFRLDRVTQPFYLHTERTIEFCCGMAKDPKSEQLVISYGVCDHEAYYAMLNTDRVRQELAKGRV